MASRQRLHRVCLEAEVDPSSDLGFVEPPLFMVMVLTQPSEVQLVEEPLDGRGSKTDFLSDSPVFVVADLGKELDDDAEGRSFLGILPPTKLCEGLQPFVDAEWFVGLSFL